MSEEGRSAAAFGKLLGAGLGAAVYFVAGVVALYPYDEPRVVFATAVAAGLGALLAPWLASSRARTLPAVVLCFGAAALALLARGLWLDSTALARALGPSQALFVGQLATSCACGLGVALGLRTLTTRLRSFSFLEALVVSVACAQLVAAHRFGAINRPFQLADSILARGGDPTFALLSVGALASALVIALLLRERSIPRALLHLSLVAAVIALLLTTTRLLHLPQAPAGASGLGLRPDEKPTDDDGSKTGQRPSQAKSDNERLEFRDNYDSEGRQVPLAVVLLHDDYSPPTGLYYFRQTAFSQYNGKRLVAATSPGLDPDIAPSFVSQKTELARVPNDGGVRAELETTVALLADHTRPFALESAQRIEPLRNPDASRFRRVYRVGSSALSARAEELLGRGVRDPTAGESFARHYTQGPSDPRYAQLSQEIVASIPEGLRHDEVARGLAVSLWLSREGTYSLKSGHAAAADPTADFLFGDRVGYCVHFSHAAVYLMRALGIPSRVGAGYVVDEAARQGGSSILVTGANSHAWPEMYVTGVGWVVVDVAPQSSLDPPPPPPDPDLQRLLGDMARGLTPMPQGEDQPLQPVLAAARRLRGLAVAAVAYAALLSLVLGYAVKLWRRLSPAFTRRGLPRVGYRAELDRLAEVALRRRRGETREGFARRVERTVPSFVRLTERHLASKFGVPRPPDLAELRALRRAVARELRASVSWWRRWLGALSPFSWLGSR